MLGWVRTLLARRRRRVLRVWYDDDYRLPLSGMEAPGGLETRRADDAAWYLIRSGAVRAADFRAPHPASFVDLSRVHTAEYLESLQRPETLAAIFAADPSDLPVDEVLRTVRLACGGTIDAARAAAVEHVVCLNMMGGFHHAAPGRGAGFCALNDVAAAVLALRADGFVGQINVIDLDAHPADGTAECLRAVPSTWVGSLTGSDWGRLEGADEVVLPARCGDESYLVALAELLRRMPRPELAFVLAGGDVLADDPLGQLGLSLDGARRRDLAVIDALGALPQVWLPAGGYTHDAWKVLAGTGLALAFHSREAIPRRYDPLAARFHRIADALSPDRLGDAPMLTEADLAESLGVPQPGSRRLLGYYTPQGIEYALFQLGMLLHVQRLGYERLRVAVDGVGSADRFRLYGTAGNTEHVLVESVLERRRIGAGMFLFVNWLTLRNPRARFSERRPQLPGQEVPGLGLAREVAEAIALMARRLLLDGVAFRPSWYHMAYAARYRCRFADPLRQGRFEAMVRDFAGLPLLEVTLAAAEKRLRLNDEPYEWEPEDMVFWLKGPPRDDRAAVQAEAARCRFSLAPRTEP